MRHKTLTPNQKEWLGWIIKEYWDWLHIHINAPTNHQRLNWSYTTGFYDVVTGELLNFIRNRFNEDEEAKKQWKEYNNWKVKLNDKI